MIVVNNYEMFTENYDDYVDIISSISRECEKFGIFFCISASGVSAVRGKTSQNFPTQLCLQFNNTSNIINLANVRSSLQKNTYTTSPLVDKTEISSNAMQLFQKDMDIRKFTQIAMDDTDDTSYLEEIEKLYHLFYDNTDFYLPRKKEKFQLWLNIPRDSNSSNEE